MSQGFLSPQPERGSATFNPLQPPPHCCGTVKVSEMRSITHSLWEEYTLDGEGGGGWEELSQQATQIPPW